MNIRSAHIRLLSLWAIEFAISAPSRVVAQEEQVLSAAPVPLKIVPAKIESDAAEDSRVALAVERAVSYLISQQREDGSIMGDSYSTTMTSLAIMALASTGTTSRSPNEGGQAIRRALDFVLRPDRQDDQGYFGNADGSRMYGHAITTLMLSEMLGMGSDARQDALIEARCQRAIDLLLGAQAAKKPIQYRGGWRYTPDANDSDLSVTVWGLLALRSAKNDGLKVPAQAIEQAIDYLRRSYTDTLDGRGNPTSTMAGFSYLPDGNDATFAMTSAGLLAMQICGQYDSPLVAGAADWLLEHPPQWTDRFFFYGTYYYAQGMYQVGGQHADKAQERVRALLLENQQLDGAWAAAGGDEQGPGKVYATSLAILSLSVHYHYLPIYQR